MIARLSQLLAIVLVIALASIMPFADAAAAQKLGQFTYCTEPRLKGACTTWRAVATANWGKCISTAAFNKGSFVIGPNTRCTFFKGQQCTASYDAVGNTLPIKPSEGESFMTGYMPTTLNDMGVTNYGAFVCTS